MQPIDYLAIWRMTLAQAAVTSSKMSMVEIAEMAGYQSVSAFSIGFRRTTGFSPGFYVQTFRPETVLVPQQVAIGLAAGHSTPIEYQPSVSNRHNRTV